MLIKKGKTMENTRIKNIIIEKVKEVYDRARALYPNYTRPFPKVSFKYKLTQTRGLAICMKNELVFTIPYYKIEKESFLNDCIPHEIAHLVDFALNKKIGHSYRWKRICRHLGGTGDRCFSIDTKQYKDTYVYTCKCRDFHLSKIIHNKMLKGQRRHCIDCNGTLQYKTFSPKIAI